MITGTERDCRNALPADHLQQCAVVRHPLVEPVGIILKLIVGFIVFLETERPDVRAVIRDVVGQRVPVTARIVEFIQKLPVQIELQRGDSVHVPVAHESAVSGCREGQLAASTVTPVGTGGTWIGVESDGFNPIVVEPGGDGTGTSDRRKLTSLFTQVICQQCG